MKKQVAVLFLTLSLTVLLTLFFHINHTKAQPRIWIVDDDGPADYRTIGEAINFSYNGDTIFVKNGTYYEHIIINKAGISLIGEDKEATIIDGNGTWTVVCVSAPNVLVENLTIRNAERTFPGRACIYMYCTTNLTVRRNILKSGYCGILLWRDCNNALFKDNQISDNVYGIASDYGCTDISIIGNHLSSAQFVGISTKGGNDNITIIDNVLENVKGSNTADAIDLWSTHDVMVVGNDISLYNNKGIFISGGCTNIVVDNNNLTDGEEGICVEDAKSVFITGNTIRNQQVSNLTGTGISIGSLSGPCTISGNTLADNYEAISIAAGGHTIFHNIFVNNTIQTTVFGASIWDDGYLSGGNYWSDYSGIDLNSGVYQNETGADGIGDTPYIIDQYNVDLYPLMRSESPQPWLSIAPQSVTAAKVGDEFNVTLTINEVDPRIRIVGIQFRLRYNSTMLETRESWICEGSFLKDSAARANFSTSFEIYVEKDELVIDILILSSDGWPKTVFPVGTGSLVTIGFNATFQNPAEDTNDSLQICNVTLTGSETAEILLDTQKTEQEGQCLYVISSLMLPTDLNKDRTVNIVDIGIVAVAFGSTPGTPTWNAAADLDQNGRINIVDVARVAMDYGKTV